MKKYSTPEILFQSVSPVDVLTWSPLAYFINGLGYDDETKLDWWADQ